MYISPAWFNGYDVAFELVFGIISLVIAFFALRIYKASDQKPAKLLSFAFFSISLSYIIKSVFNFLIISKLNETVCGMINLSSAVALDSIGLYLHMIFMLIGLVILMYMVLKFRKARTFWIFLAVTFIAMIYSQNMPITYYAISALYLAVISWHYIENFLSNKQTKTLLVAIAFIFLFFGSIHFLLSVNHQLFYVIGHFLELVAYILILINFYLVLKK